jgi:hypothetical protein
MWSNNIKRPPCVGKLSWTSQNFQCYCYAMTERIGKISREQRLYNTHRTVVKLDEEYTNNYHVNSCKLQDFTIQIGILFFNYRVCRIKRGI